MPDDPVIPPPPPGWEKILQAAKELVIVIGAVAGAIFAGIGQCQGKKTGDEVQAVAAKQVENAEKIDAVQHTVTKTAQKVGAKPNGGE
jgi:hypothetical protein